MHTKGVYYCSMLPTFPTRVTQVIQLLLLIVSYESKKKTIRKTVNRLLLSIFRQAPMPISYGADEGKSSSSPVKNTESPCRSW